MPWFLGLGLEEIHSCALQDQLSSSLQGLVTFKDVAMYLSWEEWRLFTGPEDPVPGRDVE